MPPNSARISTKSNITLINKNHSFQSSSVNNTSSYPVHYSSPTHYSPLHFEQLGLAQLGSAHRPELTAPSISTKTPASTVQRHTQRTRLAADKSQRRHWRAHDTATQVLMIVVKKEHNFCHASIFLAFEKQRQKKNNCEFQSLVFVQINNM